MSPPTWSDLLRGGRPPPPAKHGPSGPQSDQPCCHKFAGSRGAPDGETARDDERFTAKTTVLIESVEHQIEEEEEVWFPKVREALGRKALSEIGARMEEMRPTAPRSPSEPGAIKKAMTALVG